MPTAKQLKSRFRRKEITNKILKSLIVPGAVYIAAGSPYFALNLLQNLDKINFKKPSPKDKKLISDSFSYLKRRGMISIEYDNNQIYIKLTKEGKKLAKHYQINELEIARPKKWDQKWRLLMFDIPQDIRLKREALRGKLKQLGFTMIQKSIWLHPFPCNDEVKLLQEFFAFKDKHYLLIETGSLGPYEKKLETLYKLS